jgi:hypothetical protein
MKTITKRILSLTMIMAMCICMSIPVFAAEDATTVPTPVEAAVVGDESGIMPRNAGFSISFTKLGANNYVAYLGTFSLTGTEKLGYSSSWTPTAQEIKIGVRNTSTGKIYDTVIYNGDASGTFKLSSKSVPAGEYQVIVINPYGASYSVTGNVNFEWK